VRKNRSKLPNSYQILLKKRALLQISCNFLLTFAPFFHSKMPPKLNHPHFHSAIQHFFHPNLFFPPNPTYLINLTYTPAPLPNADEAPVEIFRFAADIVDRLTAGEKD